MPHAADTSSPLQPFPHTGEEHRPKSEKYLTLPDLAEVIAAWPRLSVQNKARILALVRPASRP